VAAGALTFGDAVRIVERRGRFMQEAVPLGTGIMHAVLGLDADAVAAVCAEVSREGQVVEVANDNCPGQVVISGHTAAVEEASRRLRLAGAKRAVPLAVSAPFHCSLMVPAGERLGAVLGEAAVGELRVPVVANVDGRPNRDAGRVRDLLVRQVSSPVRWQECVRALAGEGIDTFVEVGPGKVLSGLVKRIVPSAATHNVEDPASLEAFLAAAEKAT
jgi:[acyl-carrier-protein] S-malonyltransferase